MPTLELREVVASLRAGWWQPVVGLVVGLAVGLLVALSSSLLYTAHIQLFVSTADAGTTSEAFQGSQFSEQRVASYARLLTGDELARRVIDELGLERTPQELLESVTAAPVAETVLIEVSVTDQSPRQAQRIAETIGTAFPLMVAELEKVESGVSPVRVTVADRPELPSEPSAPNVPLNAVIGALAGLLLGALIAIGRTRLDRSVKDPEEAGELAGAPVIGMILRDRTLENGHVVDRSTHGRAVEDYRQLRNNLQFLKVDEPPKVIMVSSAVPSEGKTTVVVNLAVALAEAGRRVTIIEADLRRPKVTRYLGLVGGVGLTNVLTGAAELDDVLQPYGTGGLSVIGAGPSAPNPGELLSSSHMAALVDKLRGRNDFVLVDSPPLLPVADSTGLAGHTDGTVLSVRYGLTTKDQLRQAAAALERVGAPCLGVIMNIVPPKAELATAYGYGYSYDAVTGRTPGHRPRG